MKKIQGTCHCGEVQFEIQSELQEFTTCDCSICLVMYIIPNLILYQWNMRIAKHYFCKICGIYVFHNKRAAPDYLGVNVNCLQSLEIASIPIRATEGENMTVDKKESQTHWLVPRV